MCRSGRSTNRLCDFDRWGIREKGGDYAGWNQGIVAYSNTFEPQFAHLVEQAPRQYAV